MYDPLYYPPSSSLSSIYSGLPIEVISGTWDFGDVCGGSTHDDDGTASDDDPAPPAPTPAQCSGSASCCKCIGNDQVWCWEDGECHDTGSIFDPCSDSDCVSLSSLSSCDLTSCQQPNQLFPKNATAPSALA